MRKSSSLPYRLILLLTLSGCLTSRPDCAAQTQEFGAGLKRYERAKREKVEDGQAEEVVRMNTLLTLLDVTVTDAAGARFVEGLTKEDFVVVEDGAPQRGDTLTLGDDAARMPRSIVLIMDWSGSLLPYLDESIKAAKALVEQLSPEDEMAVVTDDVKLVAGFPKAK